MKPTYRIWQFGRLPVKKDKRNIQFKDLLLKINNVPQQYDFDEKNPVPTPMFLNDTYGDCVIAGRAHQTIRFELVEQKKLLNISDNDVKTEYFKETEGQDTGLVVLNSLNAWRQVGWKAAGKNYKIKGYAQINVKDHNGVMQAIYLDVGVGIGLNLPESAVTQFIKGQVWDTVTRTTIAGGHYVVCTGYNKTGPTCVTWGRKQQMTWRFWTKYCEECYSIFDSSDSLKINFDKFDALLQKVTK
jgi:hypothetical protein